ncbi:hypothetical protein [Streptococcus sp. HPH0090]|uniref:hypothetical protein n=1 Tax=Streptococcus sp. HPH0090 TaxID=1203590 RepID=UPI00034ECA86|nr:hypothetical protein [Streptococcus sp. HPH0090]EPD87455.1 hypothetical protein HMPREF1481_00543 [Streptococcus sp. HPH0090]
MFKEKRNKGFTAVLLISLVFFALATISGFLGQIHKKPTERFADTTETGREVTMQVYGIYPEPVGEVDGGTVVYIVKYSNEGDGKFAIVESKVKDESINKLLENAESLADNPGTLTGIQLEPLTNTNFINTSKNTKIINLDEFISSILPAKSVVARNMNTRIYLSLSEYSRDSLSYIFGIVIFSGMGLMTLAAAFIIRKKTIDSFKELYRLYPELKGNLELVDTLAEFYNQDLKVILYKNHLITYCKGTQTLDLRDVWRIYLVRTSYSRFSKIYQFVYTRKDSSKKYSLTIRSTNRVEEQLEEFWQLLPKKFPEIYIGSL